MGNLQIHKALSDSNIVDSVYDVGIDRWCFSDRIPIFTYGAGPCLIIVLHDPICNHGFVAHVSDMIYPIKNRTVSNLYKKASNFIKKRKSYLGRSLDIWFGSGHSFLSSGAEPNFTDYIFKDLKAAGFADFTIHDYRALGPSSGLPSTEWNPGSILYYPDRSSLSIIAQHHQTAHESGLREIQNKRKAVPKLSGQISYEVG